MPYRRRPSRLCRLPLVALTGAVASLALLAAGPSAAVAAPTPAAAPAATQERPEVKPLSPELEEIRAREAVDLYGDPAVRPFEERKTALVSLGDSEISGEGVGTYEKGTDGPDNWCHRSPDAAIHRTGIAADVTYNVACSGASTENLRVGGTPQYADELVQSDALAIKARNTRLRMVLVVVGANDDLRFGPVMTDCVLRWFNPFQGPCHEEYAAGWQERIDGLVGKVAATLTELRAVMRDAGYADEDYRLVLMSYPSPVGPDYRDNPKFPGKLPGGCTIDDVDAAWGRNAAVPPLATGLRAAARTAGADYLDASRLFHGHEVCMENTWARGLWVDLTNPFPPNSNSVRQSFHPNERGHGAFASCLTALYDAGLREAACADPDGGGTPRLYPFVWDDVFGPLRDGATGTCVTAEGGATRNGTRAVGTACDDSRAQGWWHDPDTGAVHSELTHDRCLDVPEGDYREGAALVLWNCSGAENQRFVRTASDAGVQLSPAGAPELCLRLDAGDGAPLTLRSCRDSAD